MYRRRGSASLAAGHPGRGASRDRRVDGERPRLGGGALAADLVEHVGVVAAPEVERQRAARGRGREALELSVSAAASRRGKGSWLRPTRTSPGRTWTRRRAAADGRHRMPSSAARPGNATRAHVTPAAPAPARSYLYATRGHAALVRPRARRRRLRARRARAPEERVDGRERVLGVRPHEVLRSSAEAPRGGGFSVDGHEHVAAATPGARAVVAPPRPRCAAPRAARCAAPRRRRRRRPARAARAAGSRRRVLARRPAAAAPRRRRARARRGPRRRRAAAAQRCVRGVVRIVGAAALGRLFRRVDDVQPVEELRHRSAPMRGSPSSATVVRPRPACRAGLAQCRRVQGSHVRLCGQNRVRTTASRRRR